MKSEIRWHDQYQIRRPSLDRYAQECCTQYDSGIFVLYGLLEFFDLSRRVGEIGLDEERSLISLGLYMVGELLIADTI